MNAKFAIPLSAALGAAAFFALRAAQEMPLEFEMRPELEPTLDRVLAADQFMDTAFSRVGYRGSAGVYQGTNSELIINFTQGEDQSALFPWGAVSQQITAALIIEELLAERLRPDDLACKLLDMKCDAKTRAVTIQQLLQHRSGMDLFPGTFWDRLNFSLRDKMPTSLEAYVSYLKDSGIKEPGIYKFSNFGYSVLARILEMTRAQSWQDLANDLIRRTGILSRAQSLQSLSPERGKPVFQAVCSSGALANGVRRVGSRLEHGDFPKEETQYQSLPHKKIGLAWAGSASVCSTPDILLLWAQWFGSNVVHWRSLHHPMLTAVLDYGTSPGEPQAAFFEKKLAKGASSKLDGSLLWYSASWAGIYLELAYRTDLDRAALVINRHFTEEGNQRIHAEFLRLLLGLAYGAPSER